MENQKAIKGIEMAAYTVADTAEFLTEIEKYAINTWSKDDPDEEFYEFTDGSGIRRVQDSIQLFDDMGIFEV